jgi:O-phosphoseryl-tRNA(Cys) synthetase
MHFKLTITRECYTELKLKEWKKNNGKYLSEIIGTTGITNVFYPNGTVEVYTKSSNNPHKLESEYDRSRLLIFLGQVRDRLITFLADIHERIVPDIMEWELTQCDINKDIKVSDWLQFTGLKMHVRHLDHIFRIYIKSMGKDTVCRVEEIRNPKNKPVIEAINDIFNPNEKIEKQGIEERRQLSEIHNMLSQLIKGQKND